MTRTELENMKQTPENLAKMSEELGYGRGIQQLQMKNGAFVSSLLDFFQDNPGAIEVVFEWTLANLELDEESDVEDEEENEGDE